MNNSTTMSYDELFAVGDMEKFLLKAQIECRKKIGSMKIAGMEAEDVVQEALIKVVRALDYYNKKTGKLSTFVDHVLSNMIRDCLRKAGSRKNLMLVNAVPLAVTEDFSGDDEVSSDTSKYVTQVACYDAGFENCEFLLDMMENVGLTEREKRIFKLRMYGYDFTEIASMLGIKKSRLSQIWSDIKAKYEKIC